MSEPTIRERIEEISVLMRQDPPPAEIRGYEVELAGLLWRVNKEATAAEIAFRKAVVLADGPSVAAREELAKASEPYGRLLEAKATRESCFEMLRSCRSALKSVSDEMRMQR